MSSSTSSSSPIGAALDATAVAPWVSRKFVLRALLWPAVAVLLAEGVCRIVSPIYLENPDPSEVEVEAPGYRALRPNWTVHVNVGGKPVAASINADGFRDDPFPAERSCLVVGVGNSFVANWAIDRADFWSTHLQERLAHGVPNQRCAVRSVGFQGWTLGEIDAALADRVLPQKPDVVVLVFNNLTMWSTTALRLETADKAIQKWRETPHDKPQPVVQPAPSAMGRVIGLYNLLEGHSALLGTLKARIPMLPMTLGLTQLAVPAIYRDAEFATRRAPTLTSLDALHARITRQGAQFVLVLAPSLPETDSDVYDLMLAVFGGSERAIDAHRPAAALAVWAHARSVPFVDLTPVLAGHVPSAMSYVDHHWNEVGNALAAELLEPIVRGQLQAR